MDLTVLTDAELDDLRRDIGAERERRLLVDTAAAQVAAITARYEAAVGDMPPVPIEQVAESGAVAPGRAMIRDGIEWVNVSGGWLSPWAAGPDVFGRGWRRRDQPPPNPDSPVEWVEGLAVAVGDLVSEGGVQFRARVAHTTHQGWRPSADVAGAVWKRVVVDPPPSGPQPWVQPVPGQPDRAPYGKVDEDGDPVRVTHGGRVWRSEHDSNVWEPGAPGTSTLWIDEGAA